MKKKGLKQPYFRKGEKQTVFCMYNIYNLFISVPLPCIVGPWTDWSAPDATGTRYRVRVMVRPALNGGNACPELIQIGKGT